MIPYILYGLVNLAVFILYGVDKSKAKRGKWRIPERTLLIAAVFGVIGALLGMLFFHHKTKKAKFSLGVPAILVIEVVIFLLAGCGPKQEAVPVETTTVTQESTVTVTESEAQAETTRETSSEEIPEETSEARTIDPLTMYVLDVGQGDAILFTCGGQAMLVDGGSSHSSDIIYATLKELGITKIDLMISTHPHDDHVGGLSGAFYVTDVKTVWSPVTEYEGYGFQNLLGNIDRFGAKLVVPAVGDTFVLGSATVEVLGPIAEEEEDLNDLSIVVRITHGANAFLLTGDATVNEEAQILALGVDVRANVLKAGHHGSEHSSSEAFLAAVQPEIVIASCGAYNDHGHPMDAFLNRIKAIGARLYRTDLQGRIMVISDGETIRCETEKNPDADTFQTYHELYAVRETGEDDEHPEENETRDYVLNTKSMKFHLPDCKYVGEIYEGHKQEFHGTREDLLSQGYTPCGNCKP
ncbi:MAG: DUF1294 domain-containing protein [Lachnospiraceae bacterium]|nr:DUF1294 domain-containing protein [Lachnospiraceae bacterium]